MQLKVFVVLIVLAYFHQALGNDFTPTETYVRKDFLDKNNNVKLFWKFDDTYITFELHVKTNGWIGVGFSTKPEMKNADIVVGWVLQDGNSYITDRHGPSDGNGFPKLDESQDVELLEARECGGITMIKFKRKLKSCDPNDLSIGEDTLRIIYAYGVDDPTSNNELSWADMHLSSKRGAKSAVLLSGSVPPPDYGNEHREHFDIHNNGHPIPIQNTYYNCRMFEIPKLDKKHHVTQFEPIIDENFVANVRHLLINICGAKTPNGSNVGQNEKCYEASTGSKFVDCNYVIGGWVIGGGSFYFPKDVGFPLGTADSPKYIVLETHYDNPDLIEILDHSGFRVHYTEDLRLHDSGMITLGVISTGYNVVIPPGQEEMALYAQCDAGCLAAGMDAIGVDHINVFAATPHTRSVGRSVRVQHIRNGTELPNIVRDDYFDFDYQESRSVSPWRVIKKGDTILTRCAYDTSARTITTVGGPAKEDEMCLAFLYYYPRIPIGSCLSYPRDSTYTLGYILGVQGIRFERRSPSYSLGSLVDLTITRPDHLANMTMAEASDQFNWTKDKAEFYEQQTQNMMQNQFCSSTKSISNPLFTHKPMVKINEIYVESKTDCSALPSAELITEAVAAMCPITPPTEEGSGQE